MEKETRSRGKRTILMYDITGKQLSNASLKNVEKYFQKGYGEWIELNKSFKLNHEIKKVTPTDKLFDIVYNKQNGKCNISGKKIKKNNSELHHKYIPRNIFVCNFLWNLEVLSKEEHKKIHQNEKLIINKLIILGKILNKHKDIRRSIIYYGKRVYIFFKYKKSRD